MSATDELRRLLDERGVEWDGTEAVTFWNDYSSCAFDGNNGEKVTVHFRCTPEQAVDATLGRGECHTVSMDCFGNPPYNQSGLNGNSTACGCSECGAPWSTMGVFRGNALKHNFKACPICGRKVVDT